VGICYKDVTPDGVGNEARLSRNDSIGEGLEGSVKPVAPREKLQRALALWVHLLVRPLKRLKSRAPAVITCARRRNAGCL